MVIRERDARAEAYELPGTLPPPHPALRCSIAIPARDEAATIGATLASIAAQRAIDGRALERGCFETIVFANGCTDATAAAARTFAERGETIVHVVEAVLPAGRAHVGTARRAAMGAAAARLLSLGRSGGAVATTDADTILHPRWVAETLHTLAHADAVGGRVVPDFGRSNAPLAAAAACEERYRFAIARAEAACDPLPYDPWPRHGQQFAASLAVRAGVYRTVGGLPAIARLEDLALYAALTRADARFVHSLRVRVTTSVRLDARATGGFATHLSELDAVAARGAGQLVECSTLTLARIHGRAALRRRYARGPDALAQSERRASASTFAASDAEIAAQLTASPTFGAAFVEIEARAEARGAFARPLEPVRAATASLERFARDRAGASEMA